MKFLLTVIFCGLVFFQPACAFAVELCAVSAGSVLISETRDIRVSVQHMALNLPEDVLKDGEDSSLIFEVLLENTSTHIKQDIGFPLTIRLADEFGNRYHKIAMRISEREGPEDMMSLYPGGSIRVVCRYQAPVSAAKVLLLKMSDTAGVVDREFSIPTANIENWITPADADEKISPDDFRIVYPRDRKVFAPGEKVFLKLKFSESAGRPKNIHIILPDEMMTDTRAEGRYELQLTEDMTQGDLQILVVAEWEGSPESRIVSKTLVLQIKG